MAKGTGIMIDPVTGDLQTDTARDTRGLIARGIAVGDVTAQNQAVILRATKGEFKEYPTLGVGIDELLNDHETTGWAREIALQLEADGMVVREVKIDRTNRKIVIDAHYDWK